MVKKTGRETHPEGEKVSLPKDERHRLKELREKRGWSQAELARRTGTTQGTISNLESGKTQPYLSVYQRVVAVLHGKEIGADAEDALRRINAGAAQLEDGNRKAVESIIESLLKAQDKH